MARPWIVNSKGFSAFALVILITLMAVVLAGALYFYSKIQTSEEPLREDGGVAESKKVVDEKPAEETVPISCSDYDCFIEASKNCTPSKGTVSYGPMRQLNFVVSGSIFYEIRGAENGDCVFYIRSEKSHLEYSSQLIQQELQSGLTMEEIRENEAKLQELQKAGQGRDGTCKFHKTSDLTDVLARMKAGIFTLHIPPKIDDADCSGPMFELEPGS